MVQEGFTVETQVLQELEQIRTAMIHCVLEGFNQCADVVRSHQFVTMCKFQTSNDNLERELAERSDIHFNDRKILETGLEECRKRLRGSHSPEWVLMHMQAMLARVGISMARQTLITEHFKPERIDDSEDEDGEDEGGTEEVVDGGQVNQNADGHQLTKDPEPTGSGVEELEE